MAKIISICNQKGGVGKTTTAVNLAAFLAEKGKHILIVDLDPQGNTSSALAVNKQDVDSSLYDFLVSDGADPALVDKSIQTTAIDKLHIMPASRALTGAEVELVGAIAREQRLKKGLKCIDGEYDYIIIDCPPSLGLLTVNAWTASESTLIPIQCEFFALEGLSQLLSTLTLVRENLNPDLYIEGILLTMADFRTKLTGEVINEVNTFFAANHEWSKNTQSIVFKTVIPRNVKLTEAPGFAKTIFEYDRNSVGARKYAEFGAEFLERNTPSVHQPVSRIDVAGMTKGEITADTAETSNRQDLPT